MRKLRVIVCGVGFGRYYIEAILRLPDLFELVGILSRGSKNSIKLAEKYGVPLMTDIEEISKENVDAVCVVVKSSIVGGNGMAINYLEIKKQIRQKLSKPIDFEDTDNLLELGLSSLVIMKLVNQWRKQGIKISFGVLMEHPTLREWWELIQKTLEKADSKKRTAKKEKRIMADMYQEFPLTDVQYAYWVGRDERQALGGIGCHAYLEFDGKAVDQSRLRHAWAVVQQHHPMLRACFLNNGAQKILAKPYKGELKINDYSSMQEEEAQRAALSIRNRLSHRKLHIEKGEVAGLELTLLPHGKTRLHIDVDLLVADVQSLHILLRDIFTVYNGGELPQESKEWNFATYLKEQETEENEEKERAKEYWNGRLETLPKGPDLPLAKRPEEIQKPIFKRRVVRIQKREWENLQNRAKEYQTTQAMLLLTAYSAVLERWSRNKRFLVNIPYFNRKTEKTGLEDVIADFTTLLLLEVNCDGKPTFLELLHRIEKQLHEDMKNTSYSGVQVQRDMSKLHGEASVSAPIVFACNLGTPLVNSEFQKCIGKFSYMISQTPQVWIDFQSYEDEEGIQLTWDSVDELFPEFMIQDMINSFEKLLHRLETENWEQKFDVLPENRKKFLEKLCDVGTPEQTTCIHAAFLQRAREHPEKVALVDTGKEHSVTYGELKEYATEIAEELYRSGIRNEPVAITLPRGYEQIMAIMGVLLSGNMYVSVSGSQPKERRKLIHEKTGVRYVITNNEWKKVIEWPNETKLFLVEEIFSKAQYSSDDGKIQLPIEIDKEQKETILRWINDLLKEGIVREEQERIIKTGKKIELSECVYEVYDYFRQLKPCLQKILTGEENALDVFYEKNQELAPNRLISKIPGNDEIIMMLLRILEILTVSNKGNTVQILEIGTRDESITRKILENLKERQEIVF